MDCPWFPIVGVPYSTTLEEPTSQWPHSVVLPLAHHNLGAHADREVMNIRWHLPLALARLHPPKIALFMEINPSSSTKPKQVRGTHHSKRLVRGNNHAPYIPHRLPMAPDMELGTPSHYNANIK